MSKTMLIVADEGATARWLPLYCEQSGWSVAIARDAAQARARLAQGCQPAVALVDAVLGEDDGYETCQEIRHARPDAYLVMTSARAGRVARLKARAAGADAYLSKPFELADLADLIESRKAQSWD
jgi:DNA-binding response OmpR family regulator